MPQPAGVVEIDGLPYFLGRVSPAASPDQLGGYAWSAIQVPTQEGDPTQPRRMRWDDWSRGIGDSQDHVRGAVEFARRADLVPGRIAVGPRVIAANVGAELGGAGTFEIDDIVPLSINPVAGNQRFIVLTKRNVNANQQNSGVAEYTIRDGVFDHHYDRYIGGFGIAEKTMSGQQYGNRVAIALGDQERYWVRTGNQQYVQNTLTDPVAARAFGLDRNGELWRGNGNGVAKWAPNVTSENIHNEDGWGTLYDIGDRSRKVTKVFSIDRWDLALKEEGLYVFNDQTSEEANQLADLIAYPSLENRQAFIWYNEVCVTTVGGLYRYNPRGAYCRTVGVEEVETSENVLDGARPTAGVAFGHFVYVAYRNAANNRTYIVRARRSEDYDVDSGGSPLTFIGAVDDFAGECKAMAVIQSTTGPWVVYNDNGNIRAFGLTATGGYQQREHQQAVEVDLSPSDLGSPFTQKYFRGVEAIVRRATGGRWRLRVLAAMDGSALFRRVGGDMVGDGFHEAHWTRDNNDSGREVQLRIQLDPGGAFAGDGRPELHNLVLNYEERPVIVEGAVVGVVARDHHVVGEVVDSRTAQEVREHLEALMDGKPVLVRDPWGNEWAAAVSRYTGEQRWQHEGSDPAYDVQFVLRRLDY